MWFCSARFLPAKIWKILPEIFIFIFVKTNLRGTRASHTIEFEHLDVRLSFVVWCNLVLLSMQCLRHYHIFGLQTSLLCLVKPLSIHGDSVLMYHFLPSEMWSHPCIASGGRAMPSSTKKDLMTSMARRSTAATKSTMIYYNKHDLFCTGNDCESISTDESDRWVRPTSHSSASIWSI